MKQIKIKGRPAYPGKAAGEAIVCPHSIQGWAGVSEETGCIIEVGHPERGKSIKGKILVIPYGKGSTGWSGHFHSAAVAGFSPVGFSPTSIPAAVWPLPHWKFPLSPILLRKWMFSPSSRPAITSSWMVLPVR